MEFFQKVKKKIDDGFLQEFAGELRWLWQYIRRYRMTVVIHILLGVLGILMGLGSSVASKYLIDAVTGYKTGTIGLAASLMVGMQLGNIAMRSISSRVGAVINIRVQNEMQAEVYRRILATDWESVERFRSGDLLNRLNSDASGVASGVTSFIPSLISSSVQFVGAFAIIAYYDPTMAVLALLGVPVSVLASRVLIRRMRDYNREMKGIYSDLMSFHEDSFQNITSIKAFGITGLFDEKMDGLLGTYRDAYLRYNQFSVKTTALMSLMGLVVSASCFGWGVYRLWTGAISYGSMTMFLQLASSLGSAFSTLIGLAPTAISISTSAGRIMAVVELPAEDATPDEDFLREGAYSIDLRGVTFRYQGGEPVLRDADVTAQPGDLVALTGPSGEGKTTLLRILLGLARPSAGEAALIGASGRRYPVSAATRSAFGYVPQGNSIFAGTIADNLRLTKPDATDAELETVLKAACAYDFVKELPGGMQYTVGGRGKGLSEGQAQRIAVARALLRGAPILLLDEATSALDEDTEERMLRNLMEGGWVRTCILVTHRPGSRKFCTRGYRVRDGRVEAC
ncbi:MAG: ABC transporter ATP-binding protein [Butyricicoccus sp.]